MNLSILYYISRYDFLFLINSEPRKLILQYMALNYSVSYLNSDTSVFACNSETSGITLMHFSWFSFAYRKFGENISIYLCTFVIT